MNYLEVRKILKRKEDECEICYSRAVVIEISGSYIRGGYCAFCGGDRKIALGGLIIWKGFRDYKENEFLYFVLDDKVKILVRGEEFKKKFEYLHYMYDISKNIYEKLNNYKDFLEGFNKIKLRIFSKLFLEGFKEIFELYFNGKVNLEAIRFE